MLQGACESVRRVRERASLLMYEYLVAALIFTLGVRSGGERVERASEFFFFSNNASQHPLRIFFFLSWRSLLEMFAPNL